MQLFAVMRFGNDEDGPDGADTEFLILASSIEQAADTVDSVLLDLPHTQVDSFCHAIALIADSHSRSEDPLILSGPALVQNSRLAVGIPEENIWRREEDVKNAGWVLLKDY